MECPNCGHRLSINRDYEKLRSGEKYTISIWCTECGLEEELVLVIANQEDADTVYKRMFQKFITDASAGMYSNN